MATVSWTPLDPVGGSEPNGGAVVVGNGGGVAGGCVGDVVGGVVEVVDGSDVVDGCVVVVIGTVVDVVGVVVNSLVAMITTARSLPTTTDSGRIVAGPSAPPKGGNSSIVQTAPTGIPKAMPDSSGGVIVTLPGWGSSGAPR